MAQKSHPSKAQMNTHLVLEAIIAATSVMSLSSSLASLWAAKKASGKAVREVEDVIEDPVGKTTDTVGRTAGQVKKGAAGRRTAQMVRPSRDHAPRRRARVLA